MSDTRILPQAAIDWLDRSNRQELLAVDSHTGGNPTRIVLSGITLPEHVAAVDAARAWLRDHADHWRRRLVHEPRGGGLTCAVLPVHSREDGCDIGAVILEPGSYPPMCGHCMIGFASVIVEMDMLPDLWTADPTLATFRIRTPAGPVGVKARREAGKFSTITLTNVESFTVLKESCTVDGRTMPVELLYGGDYYISVDARSIGLSLDRANATEIVRLARRLKETYTADGVFDPISKERLDVYQVLFYEYDPANRLDARIVVVAPPGVIDRSPCGTGSSALLALRVARGEVAVGQTLTTHSIVGGVFAVRTESVERDGERLLVSPLLTGSAHLTGFARVFADPLDPLGDGFPPL
jgi:proline racemase